MFLSQPRMTIANQSIFTKTGLIHREIILFLKKSVSTTVKLFKRDLLLVAPHLMRTGKNHHDNHTHRVCMAQQETDHLSVDWRACVNNACTYVRVRNQYVLYWSRRAQCHGRPSLPWEGGPDSGLCGHRRGDDPSSS